MNNVITFYKKTPTPITVNGEPISREEIEALTPEFSDARKPAEAAARALVVRALLRQRAVMLEIEASDEEEAIEKLLEREVVLEPVFEEEIRRYFDGNQQKFRSGDLFEARHILFDTTGDVDLKGIVQKAEGALLLLKNTPERFEEIAKAESRCTSANIGGSLGQLSQESVVPEFWAALTGYGKPGLLPYLVESRFGHHIIMIDHCAMGQQLPFEAVQERIRSYLTSRLEQQSYQQYIAQLVEHANITGIDLSDQQPQPAGPGLPPE